MFEIIGKKQVDYFSKKNQRQVSGTTLYCRYTNESIEGYGVKEIFVSSKVGYPFADFVIGSVIKVYYNEFGNIADIIFQ